MKEIIRKISDKCSTVKFLQIMVKNSEQFINKVGRLLGNNTAAEFLQENNISDNSLVFLAYGNKKESVSR